MNTRAQILEMDVLWTALARHWAAATAAAPTGPATRGRPPRNATPRQSEAGEPRADTSHRRRADAGAPAPAPRRRASGRARRPQPRGGRPQPTRRRARRHRGRGPPAKSRRRRDRIDLGTATVTGDREQPKVMYIVPWKKSDIGDLSGKPMNSLLDEVLAPVDRDEFKREVVYYQAVKADASQNGASRPAGASRVRSKS